MPASLSACLQTYLPFYPLPCLPSHIPSMPSLILYLLACFPSILSVHACLSPTYSPTFLHILMASCFVCLSVFLLLWYLSLSVCVRTLFYNVPAILCTSLSLSGCLLSCARTRVSVCVYPLVFSARANFPVSLPKLFHIPPLPPSFLGPHFCLIVA